MYKRCFTFGCSFTRYAWPTWADILHHTNDIPVTNWALPGIGNYGIMSLMLECDLKYKFTEDDLILVMWSGWTREDRFIQGRWKNVGSVLGGYFYDKHFYDKLFVSRYWDWDNDVIRNSNAIILANRSFNISDQYSIFPYGDNDVPDMISPSKKFDFYLQYLPKIITMDIIPNSRFDSSTKDDHPDVLCHINFYNRYIASKFNLNLVTENSVYHSIQQKLIDAFNPEFDEENCIIADECLSSIKNIFAPVAIEVSG
jgi:hypothetical protein